MCVCYILPKMSAKRAMCLTERALHPRIHPEGALRVCLLHTTKISPTKSLMFHQKTLHSTKIATYSTKKAVYSTKRAMYSTKRAIYSTKRAIHSTHKALHSTFRTRGFIVRALIVHVCLGDILKRQRWLTFQKICSALCVRVCLGDILKRQRCRHSI